MFYVIISLLISLLIFSGFMVVYWDEKISEFNQRLEIQEKLIESLQDRLDLHKF